MNPHNLSIASFGIELETCMCATKGELFDIKIPVQYKKRARSIYVKRLNEIAKENNVLTTFRFEEDPRANVDYSLWTITTDNSIRCLFRPNSTPKPSFQENFSVGKPSNDCQNFSDSLEIVSPIYTYSKEGHSDFCNILENVLLNDEFIYTSNSSQGMHVNVSHPGQYENIIKTLQMWWYFEPVIMKFVRTYHRGSYYVRMLRNIFPTFESVTENGIEFFLEPDVAPAKYTALCKKQNRFEFRIPNSKMTPNHISGWLGFCVRFVVASQLFEKPVGVDQGTFDELFEYIENDEIKRYFADVIVEYDDPEYNRIVEIVNILNSEITRPLSVRDIGNSPLSNISPVDFTKMCTYNLVVPTKMFYLLLKENNKDLLQLLVNITNGENQDVILDFKSIINNFESIIKDYEPLLLSVIPTTTNEVYTFIIQYLFGVIVNPEVNIHLHIPDSYISDINYFKTRFGIVDQEDDEE